MKAKPILPKAISSLTPAEEIECFTRLKSLFVIKLKNGGTKHYDLAEGGIYLNYLREHQVREL